MRKIPSELCSTKARYRSSLSRSASVRALAFRNVDQQSARQPLPRLRIAQHQRFISQPYFLSVLPPHPVLHPERTPFFPCVFLQRDRMILRI